MKSWGNIFRVIILIIGVFVLAFNVLLYNFCEQLKSAMIMMSDQQKAEAQVNSNKFKDQQDQIAQLSKDLQDARQQIKDQNGALSDQNDALLQEAEKRHQVENMGKSIQTSLVDIKAEADAIKQDMKVWQKDYVSVLAELEKKMDDSKENINSLKADIEKITPTDKGKNENQP